MDFINENEQLRLWIELMKQLPGISAKQAQKIVLGMINDWSEAALFSWTQQLVSYYQQFQKCEQCHFLMLKNEHHKCELCLNTHRDLTQLCIVVDDYDLVKLEQTQAYAGYYYVLPVQVIKQQVHWNWAHVQQLQAQIQANEQLSQVLIATNPSAQGELIAQLLIQVIREIKPHLSLYRLGYGLPYNCQINYADQLSLKHSIIHKQQLK